MIFCFGWINPITFVLNITIRLMARTAKVLRREEFANVFASLRLCGKISATLLFRGVLISDL